MFHFIYFEDYYLNCSYKQKYQNSSKEFFIVNRFSLFTVSPFTSRIYILQAKQEYGIIERGIYLAEIQKRQVALMPI